MNSQYTVTVYWKNLLADEGWFTESAVTRQMVLNRLACMVLANTFDSVQELVDSEIRWAGMDKAAGVTFYSRDEGLIRQIQLSATGDDTEVFVITPETERISPA